MSIAILHSGDMQKISLGGVDRYIKSLILFSEDNEITVFGTTTYKEYVIGEVYQREYCGKKYRFIPISDDRKYPLSVYYMLNELKWVKELGKYDCIYAQRTEYSLPFIFSKNKRKLVEMIHGSSKYSEIGFGKNMAKIHLLMEKIAISIARYTFVILNREEFGVPYYKKKYSKYANRVFYGKNPIDPHIYHKKDRIALRKEYNISPEEKIVIFSGRIEDNPKRVLLLPQICKNLINNGVKIKFLVIGDGSDKKKLEDDVRKLNLENAFSFTGYIDDPYKIADYNNIADIAINISIFEGTCTSILESLACGIPVVSTDVGVIHECVSNGVNGYIIDNNEQTIVEEASRAINKLLTEKIEMNEEYKKYFGDQVIVELRGFINKL